MEPITSEEVENYEITLRLTPDQIKTCKMTVNFTPDQKELFETILSSGQSNKLEHVSQPRKGVPDNPRATVDPPRLLSPNYDLECPETPE